MKTKNSLIIIIAVMLSSIMMFADNIEFAYAISVTTYPNTSTGSAILRYANFVFTTGASQDTIRVYNSASGTLFSEITCTDCTLLYLSSSLTGSTNDRIYAVRVGSSGTVNELDPTFTFIARTVSASNQGAVIVGDTMYLADQVNNTIDSINLASGTLTVVNGDNTDVGANACDNPIFPASDGIDLFIICNGVTKYLAVIDGLTINGGEPEFRTVAQGASTGLTWDSVRDRLIHTSSVAVDAKIWTYASATNILTEESTLTGIQNVQTQNIGIDSANRWYFPSADGLYIVDAGDSSHPTIFTLSSTYMPASAFQASYTFNPLLTYIIDGTDWHVFNTSGIESGTGGETPPSDTGGIDCDNPANANILICRLCSEFGSGGSCDGTTIIPTGELLRNGTTVLLCNVIFVTCTDDNPQTNGIGLLLFIASLFVIVGMFYYAIGKEAFHMPIFIWIVIVVALSAFFTITGLIDPIFLILSIVAIVALAVPKIISVTRGSTFGGGSTE